MLLGRRRRRVPRRGDHDEVAVGGGGVVAVLRAARRARATARRGGRAPPSPGTSTASRSRRRSRCWPGGRRGCCRPGRCRRGCRCAWAASLRTGDAARGDPRYGRRSWVSSTARTSWSPACSPTPRWRSRVARLAQERGRRHRAHRRRPGAQPHPAHGPQARRRGRRVRARRHRARAPRRRPRRAGAERGAASTACCTPSASPPRSCLGDDFMAAPVGRRRRRPARLGVLAEGAGRRVRAADDARAGRSSGSTSTTGRLAGVQLDGRGQVGAAERQPLPRQGARAAGHPLQPRRRRAGEDDGRQEHPRLQRSSRTSGTSGRRSAGTSPTPSPSPGPASPCCRTGSRPPPARSSTSTAASTPPALAERSSVASTGEPPRRRRRRRTSASTATTRSTGTRGAPRRSPRPADRDVPVLLSVGYSACHWCHVMAHECFEDADVAAEMNAPFVNVKVDREERPDVDAIYMDAVQAMTGRGGWPMTVFLTPDGEPFYGGTYFPKPQFLQLMAAIDDAWRNRRDELDKNTDALARGARRAPPGCARPTSCPARRHVDARPCRRWPPTSTAEWGGFGAAPKFPSTMSLDLVLRRAPAHRRRRGAARDRHRRRSTRWRRAGCTTTSAAASPATRSTSEWLVPHFEKMLYDQALLVRVLRPRRRRPRTSRAGARSSPRPSTTCCATCASPAAGSRRPRTPTRPAPTATATRACSTRGPPTRCAPCSAPTPTPPSSWYGITAGGNFEGRSIPNRLHARGELRPARRRSRRPAGACSTPASSGPARASTTRCSPSGTR